MFAESVHCQLGVAKGSMKVVPRTRTGQMVWEGLLSLLERSIGQSCADSFFAGSLGCYLQQMKWRCCKNCMLKWTYIQIMQYVKV